MNIFQRTRQQKTQLRNGTGSISEPRPRVEPGPKLGQGPRPEEGPRPGAVPRPEPDLDQDGVPGYEEQEGTPGGTTG